ncbi:PRTase-like protein [Cantharellus anzutake]|uniref:PRTase-like protein n=1 Tax=Cantharellus anzutake TaxID=1750568 RepID=UPI0019065EC6|nr:PRTase-like protein [Cantharellus anzutake]KAF8327152.1 PRTase-like protein [Cantharellus anzutake]
MANDGHLRATYNDIHIVGKASERIAAEFKPNLIVAIGEGFFPARILRTFLKEPSTQKNIPIQAIGLSLYEALPSTTAEQIGKEVIRTQWLGGNSKILLGRNVLIVDEIDDSRLTLQYAVSELQADVDRLLSELPEPEREKKKATFGIFVVHNKLKEKTGKLPPGIPYFAGEEVDDKWFDYPWEQKDIYAHDALVPQSRFRS